jgi:hypothetical protein
VHLRAERESAQMEADVEVPVSGHASRNSEQIMALDPM